MCEDGQQPEPGHHDRCSWVTAFYSQTPPGEFDDKVEGSGDGGVQRGLLVQLLQSGKSTTVGIEYGTARWNAVPCRCVRAYYCNVHADTEKPRASRTLMMILCNTRIAWRRRGSTLKQQSNGRPMSKASTNHCQQKLTVEPAAVEQ
jgi:hypothetical protein